MQILQANVPDVEGAPLAYPFDPEMGFVFPIRQPHDFIDFELGTNPDESYSGSADVGRGDVLGEGVALGIGAKDAHWHLRRDARFLTFPHECSS